MPVAGYIAATLGMLVLFGIGWALIGRPVLKLILGEDRPGGAEGGLLTLASGMASCMVLLALLGSVGALNLVAVSAVLVAALAANFAMAGRRRSTVPTRDVLAKLLAGVRRHASTIVIVSLLSLPLLVSAITGSFGGDSYIYHLPQAKLLGDTGRLAVNEHLQHPLAPQYYHLLYAVALLAWDDRLANAINAASVVLCVVGLYCLGRIWVGRVAALLACAMCVAFAATLSPAVAVSAHLDYGTAVFTLFAYHCLGRAMADSNGRMLCLACLLMGVSLGIKTQAWVGIPAFAVLAVAALPNIRRPGPILAAGMLAVVVGGFWYARSFLVSGDPFHPLGGNVLGHWGWNAADLEWLHQWLADRSGLDTLQWLLVAPALATVVLARRPVPVVSGAREAPNTGVVRGALAVASLAGLATWVVTSFYDRFLLSIAPVVLLASATVVVTALRWVWVRTAERRGNTYRRVRDSRHIKARSGTIVMVAVVLATVTSALGVRLVGWINEVRCGGLHCSTIAEGIEPRRVLDEFGDTNRLRIYQLYLGHAYYYLGRDVLGMWVGPSRHRDLLALGGDGRAIAAHLAALGRNALLLHVEATGDDFLSGSFLDHFAPCGSHGRVALFVRRDALPEDAGTWPPPGCRNEPPGRDER